MHLILTHEQSDFDAVASLMAAYLLDRSAIPVMPRRMNRNVRAYLAFYGPMLPFVEARDLPSESVETVTLVDTQSLITIKGMGEHTRIHVVDHHPRRKNLPSNWHLTCDEVGATTTILVEALVANNVISTSIQATLLLLGIYEDTGSLSYASTSSRDVRAAAYVLEAGADLNVASDYLNPPLSAEQKVVFERLASGAKTHQIQGYRIVIACADAIEMEDEASTLTHKLRDSLDPDALFVLLQTSEGVRLVARSTVDGIDVAAVALYFGGGGHGRAAAALIKSESGETADTERSLESTTVELLDLLAKTITPSITVAQMMSRRPLLLTPEMQVQEIAGLMQKYGFEGFPVTQDGRVIGLLTRRAVDRAISHKLNLTAANLMDAGEVTVLPNDAIQHLQKIMIESGWGQIPVVAPDSGKVIGIATRTDLLKTLAPRSNLAARDNLKHKLEAALPPERLALLQAVIEEAKSQKVALYIVGGFVRDLLIDRPSLDFDIVVEGDAISLAKGMEKKYCGRVTTHSRFGTAKWFLSGSKFPASTPVSLDFISARMEFYAHPTALPTVERGSIKLDLHRRDFTINTLAMRLDGHRYGELLDYWGGLEDLRSGLVRVLHSLSFVDDPTRMLRAVRFEQRFGFTIEPRTLELINAALPLLEKLSGDRIRHELNLIFSENNPAAIFDRMQSLELFKYMHPLLPWDVRIKELMTDGLSKTPDPEYGDIPAFRSISRRLALGYMLWLGKLNLADIRVLASRLRLSATMREALLSLSKVISDVVALSSEKPSRIVSRLEGIHPLIIYAAILSVDEPARKVLVAYLVKWRQIKPKTSGHELIRLGLKPGPVYQDILEKLRAAWIDGIVNSEESECLLLKKLLKSPIESDRKHASASLT